NDRLSEAAVRAQLPLQAGTQLTARSVETAIRTMYETGQYESVSISCAIDPSGRTTFLVDVRERPLLGSVSVRGADVVSRGTVEGQVDLVIGQPLDPARVARAVAKIDSIYEDRGYVLATVRPDSTVTNGTVDLVFDIEEGRRLAVSGIRIIGNEALSDEEVIG